jgi:gliding-associated putative ABC transporter substrate-binding component GldG
MNSLNKIKSGSNYILVVLFLAGILVIINAFSLNHFTRMDLTEDKRYTVSKSTKKVLSELDDIVNIKVYLSTDLPPYVVMLTDQIKDILEEYKIYSDGNLEIEYIDPSSDPLIQQKLRFMGIPQVRLNTIEKDKVAIANIYMGLAVLYGDNKEIMQTFSDIATFEYDLTSKILRVASPDIKTIGFLSGHGEPELTRGFAAVDQVMKEQYYTKAVDISGGKKIPDDIAALVVATPKTLSDRDLFEIDQYLMSGKNIIFMVNTVELNQQGGMRGTPINSPVKKLIEHYGVKIGRELVLDQLNANASFKSGMYNILVPYPFWVRTIRKNVEGYHPTINNLESMVFPWTSPLTIDKEKTKNNQVSILARSTNYSWTEGGMFDLSPRENFIPAEDQMSSHVLACAVTGKFKSFFEGKEIPTPEKQEDQEKELGGNKIGEPISDRSIKTSSPDTKIIVIGNSNFVSDNFASQFEGNIAFFQNAIDWFTIGDYLIDIRSRETGDRPLKIVSDNTKVAVRYINTFAVPILVAFFGLFQFYLRRRKKRLEAR